LPEDSPERGRVGVPRATADLIDGVTGSFQQAHGVLQAGVLHVRLRPLPGSRHEPAGQTSLAQPEGLRKLGDPQRLVEVHVDVLLDLMDKRVVVRSSPAERDVRKLARAVTVDQQNLGGRIGVRVAGESLD
jgi:hypothetical protein